MRMPPFSPYPLPFPLLCPATLVVMVVLSCHVVVMVMVGCGGESYLVVVMGAVVVTIHP